MENLAKIISWVFMPLFMPMFALAAVLFIPSTQDFNFFSENLYIVPFEFKKALLSMFFIFCVAAPGFSFLILSKKKIISSVEMEGRKERSIPILIMLSYALVLYVFLVIKVSDNSISKFVLALPLSGVMVAISVYFLNLWKKISLHAAGAGILTGFILAYILFQSSYEMFMLIGAVLISGVVMSARLFLKKHDLFEVVLGWVVAVVITFCVNFFY